MLDVESIAEALFAQVSNMAGVRFATRSRYGFDQVPEFPALVLRLDGGDVQFVAHGMPYRYGLRFDVVVMDRNDGTETSPESSLNAIFLELQDALAPDDGEQVQTLGGLVEHCVLNGSFDYYPPTPEVPFAQAWFPVEILATDSNAASGGT